MLPRKTVTPAMVANSRSRNHSATNFNNATNMTDTPSPTSVRPIVATVKVGAAPNASDPTPASMPPKVTMRRVPNLSTSTPVGICITV